MRPLFASFKTGRQIGTVVILAGVYFAAAKFGLKLAFVNPSASPAWPPTGIALASLLLLGYQVWPGIFLGAFLANLTTAGTVLTSLGIATGNTLEGVVGAYLVNKYANGSNTFDRPQDIFAFAVLAAFVSTMFGATIGVTSLALGGFANWTDYRLIWLTWWLGDATGTLIVAPALVLWGKHPSPHWDERAMLERALFLLMFLPVTWLVFVGRFPFPYVTVPFLVWAAFRFGHRDTATVIALLAAIAVWGTVKGVGPFAGATPNESLLLLQIFMGIIVLVGLPLAGLVADRARAIDSERLARKTVERAVERTARLHAVTSALSEAVTRGQVVDVIVTQGIQALGGRAGYVSTLNEDGDALQLVGQVGYPEEFISTLRRVPLSTSRPMTEVLQTGQPLFFESDAPMRTRYPDLPTFFQDVARAVIPLSTAGRRIGILQLSFATPRTLDPDEQRLMLALASQCAQALERAQFYEREHNIAKTLQQAFLPAVLPEVPGIKIDAVYVPAASESVVGGDWYDVFRLPDGRIACSVGDVVGSGLQAATMMGQVRQSIRASALEGNGPAIVLARASRVLRLTYEIEGMTTAIFGVLDPVARTFTYAIAGHPPPVLATPENGTQVLAPGGLPLGLGETKPLPVGTVSLPPGSLLALYTDGLIESTRNLAEGEASLLAAMRAELDRRSGNPARTLLERVVNPGDVRDDVAVLTISIERSHVDELALSLPAEPASLRQVRQALHQLEGALHLDEDRAFVLQVVVSEAVNNTVEHAYRAGSGLFHLRVWRDAGVLRMVVADQGQWRPERPESRGQGLNIMRTLADAVEVDRQPSGTTVRLAVSLTCSPALPTSGAAPPLHRQPPQDIEGQTGTIDGREVQTGIHPRSPDGQFEIRYVEGIPVVDVGGEVDISSARKLQETLERAARLDKRVVVVSLTSASFLDSKGIQCLLRFGQRLATNRQHLLLVIAKDRPARRLVEITGLSDAFPVFESVNDAITGAAAAS